MGEERGNNSNCPYTLSNEKVVFDGKWIQTREVTFQTADRSEGVWQSVHRTTRPAGAPADGVSIIAKVRKQGKVYILLVKQYRIPTKKVILELPAGLIDKGETAQQAAIRELKEETGYTCTNVVGETTECYLDPGLTDDSQIFVLLDIDGDAPENLNPVQKLDSTESIEVILVEHSQILEYIKSLNGSVGVEASLYAYALGIHFDSMI